MIDIAILSMYNNNNTADEDEELCSRLQSVRKLDHNYVNKMWKLQKLWSSDTSATKTYGLLIAKCRAAMLKKKRAQTRLDAASNAVIAAGCTDWERICADN